MRDTLPSKDPFKMLKEKKKLIRVGDSTREMIWLKVIRKELLSLFFHWTTEISKNQTIGGTGSRKTMRNLEKRSLLNIQLLRHNPSLRRRELLKLLI